MAIKLNIKGDYKMKIYLDDVRDCPDGYILCRTAEEAIEYIKTGKVKFISFDHDLGEVPLSGYDVATFIENMVQQKEISCPCWSIHSSNPIGRKRIQQAMMSAYNIKGE